MHTCYTHEVEHHLQDGRTLRFRPRGPTYLYEAQRPKRGRTAREDRIEDWGVGLAARIFVGLNVGDKPTYTVQQVMDATRDIRRQQAALPDATFLAQRGLYTEPQDKGGRLIEEDSVQIIIFDSEGSTLDVFADKIIQLARGLRERFNQDSVIVELQEAGISQKVLAIKRE